jgi:hypothetical protein
METIEEMWAKRKAVIVALQRFYDASVIAEIKAQGTPAHAGATETLADAWTALGAFDYDERRKALRGYRIRKQSSYSAVYPALAGGKP